MTNHTLQRTNRAQLQKRRAKYTNDDVKRIRVWLRGDRGWSQARFAYELGRLCGVERGFTLGYEKLLERGERRITPSIAIALERLERDEANYYKVVCDENRETLDSLVRGVELRAGELTDALRRRLKRILNGKNARMN